MKPLEGVRVLEVGQAIAGPTTGQILRDLGAEVIKIERPGQGDIFRDVPEMGPTMFVSVNRGKKSVALDLSKPEGFEVFRRLVAVSDVVIDNLEPRASKRLGLSYESLRSVNPRLIYCKLTGFGEGPYSEVPAFDPMLQAITGIMSVTGIPPDKYVRAGISLIDMSSAFFAVMAILAALIRRERTGEGSYIDISMFDVGAFYMTYWFAYYDLYRRDPVPLGSSHIYSSPYNLFTLRDGRLFMAIFSDDQWVKFCRALGFDDLLKDPRYSTRDGRVRHKAQLEEEIQRRLRDMSLGEVFAKLREAGVAACPMYTVSQLLNDEHMKARGLLQWIEYCGLRMRVAHGPIVMDGERLSSSESPPRLGEHTVEVLRSVLGMSDEEIERLLKLGVISKA